MQLFENLSGFVPIQGFEDYLINRDGKVYSVRFGRYLKDWAQTRGYKQVQLCKNNKTFAKLVHRLLAIAFIPNPSSKPCINHINGIKTDNRLENLEWCTQKENTRHAYDTGLHKGPNINGNMQGGKCHKSKLTEDQVLEIRKLRAKGMKLKELGDLFNVDQSQISNICKKRYWKHI